MISDERVEKAVEYLRDTAEQHAQAKGAVAFHEYEIKRQKAIEFVSAAGTVADREAKATQAIDVIAAVEKYRDAIVQETLIRDMRQAAELTIEVWRTQQSNARAKLI